jgi:drug/metabolite transporter (DMT)-like permease
VKLIEAIRRDSWLGSGARIARILILPVLLIAATGWIPDKHLDLPPKGPWPWGAILGVFVIVVAFGGLLLSRETPSAKSTVLFQRQ